MEQGRRGWRLSGPAGLRGLIRAGWAVGLGACGGSAGGPGGNVEVTDSAGVQIAHTVIGAETRACVVEELFRIGSVDADDGSALFGVNDAAFLADGRLAVVNRGTSQIKVFSAAGDLLHEFGREGQGPEEFKNLWSIDVRGGDTLVVADYRPWRFGFFTPEGELIRRVELSPAMIERPDFATALSAGSGFVVEEPLFRPQDEFVDMIVPLYRFGEDGQQQGSVADFWLERFGYLSKEIGYVGNPVFGAHATIAGWPGDRILYAPGRYDQMEIWTLDGRLERVIRWTGRARDVGPDDADLWRRERRAQIEERTEITPQLEPVIEAQIGEHLPVEERYPAYGRVVVSPRGTTWVEEYRRPGDEGPARWWVFQPDGRLACEAPLSEDFLVLTVDGDRVVGLVRDQLDVEYVVGYRVQLPRG